MTQESIRGGTSYRSHSEPGYAPCRDLITFFQHRMGQTRPVTAIKLMINDSIELKLDEIQKKKANLAQLSLKNMSRKELMAQKVSQVRSVTLELPLTCREGR